MGPEQKKIKVLLVVRWPVGGIRTFHRYVYNNFSPDEYEFTLVAPDLKEAKVLLNDLDQFQIKHIKVSSNPTVLELGKAVLNALNKKPYSVIHAHGLTSALAAAVPARFHSIPLLITLHDVFVGSVLSGIKGWGKKIVLSRLWAMAHTIHCVSQDCKNNLFDYFPKLKRYDQKVIVIPNGIDVQRFLDATSVDLRKKIAEPDSVYLIGFLGRFMAQKGFRYLVDAFEIVLRHERILPLRPLILTFGEGGFFREDKSMLEEKGIASYFRFLDFEPNIAPVLKGLDLVVMPSLWEACPLQPMEALVAGTPFIGTDCLGLKEVLLGTPAKMVPVRDSQALSDAILMEMKNPSVSQSRAFQKKAAQRFDVRERAKELDELYQRMLCNI